MGGVLAVLGSTNLTLMTLLLKDEKVLVGLKAGNCPATPGLAVTRPSPLTAWTRSKLTPRAGKRFVGIPTVLLGPMTVVLPPKSVPSRATASQLSPRKPVPWGGGLAPLFTPPIAVSKSVKALLAV